jgi:hypothetical protein
MGIIELSAEVTNAFLDRCITKTRNEGGDGKKFTVGFRKLCFPFYKIL